MVQIRLTIGSVLALMLCAAATDAAALEPKKASDLVVLTSQSSCGGGGARLDTRLMPDGSVQPFTIPPKKALIVTGVSLRFSPGQNLGILKSFRFLLHYEGGQVFLEDSLLIGPGVQGSEAVSTGARLALTSPVAVQSGTNICMSSVTESAVGGLSTLVYGFLAPNK